MRLDVNASLFGSHRGSRRRVLFGKRYLIILMFVSRGALGVLCLAVSRPTPLIEGNDPLYGVLFHHNYECVVIISSLFGPLVHHQLAVVNR